MLIMISSHHYRHFMNMTIDLSRFFANISKNITDTGLTSIMDIKEIIYELSFNAITYDLG